MRYEVWTRSTGESLKATGEGPFNSLTEAMKFCDAEVGVNYVITQLDPSTFNLRLNELYLACFKKVEELPSGVLNALFDAQDHDINSEYANLNLVGRAMYKEFDVEPPEDYTFTSVPVDCHVGEECMKVLRAAKELCNLLIDVNNHEIWEAAFQQCEVIWRG